MNKQQLLSGLIGASMLVVAGAVGAQALHGQVNKPGTDAQNEQNPQPVYHDPWAAMHVDMMRMQAQMDHLFADAWHGFPNGPAYSPADGQARGVTLEEQDDNYVVKARVPGATENDILVDLRGRLLSISTQAQGTEQRKADNGGVLSEERFSQSFQLTLTLPGPVDASQMQTDFEDGTMTVTIPKAAS